MAKTIKFNLIMDNKPIRSISDLQDNFVIEDTLKYYKNGLLLKWLSVRGFDEYFRKVSTIDPNCDDITIISQLVKLFDIEVDDAKIETGIEILHYLNRERELAAYYDEKASKKKKIIADYINNYEEIVRHIVENCDNLAVLRADVSELGRNYKQLFEYNSKSLFRLFKDEAPKAIFAVLCHEDLRESWLNDDNKYINDILTTK
jgi:hypothetical protein